jgi:DNA-directed RNA polymerase specialized sigma24 family protein
VLEAIEKSVAILAPSFVFGYFDVEDIKQEGRLEAFKVLEKEKYDPDRPLANFLYTSIRNKYVNLLRDKLRRNDPPCQPCHIGDCCNPTGNACEPYIAWRDRNAAKSNLMRPLDLAHVADENERRTRLESTVVSDVETDEIVKLIDAKLSVELRSTYLQMRAGVSVPKVKRKQVEDAVRDIIRGSLEWQNTNEDD